MIPRTAAGAGERRWVWLLGTVGLLLAAVALANVAELAGALLDAGDAAPLASRVPPPVDAVPGIYHLECFESRPSLATRFRHAVRQALPARLTGAEAGLPACRRCAEPIERGSALWIAETE